MRLLLLAALTLFCLSGCLGTLASRGSPGVGFGKPLWDAAAGDIAILNAAMDGTPPFTTRGERVSMSLIGLICTPIDFAADTALLPIDLIGMSFGLSKVELRKWKSQ